MTPQEYDHAQVHEGFHPQFHTEQTLAEVDRMVEEGEITSVEAIEFIDALFSAPGEEAASETMNEFWQSHHLQLELEDDSLSAA